MRVQTASFLDNQKGCLHCPNYNQAVQGRYIPFLEDGSLDSEKNRINAIESSWRNCLKKLKSDNVSKLNFHFLTYENISLQNVGLQTCGWEPFILFGNLTFYWEWGHSIWNLSLSPGGQSLPSLSLSSFLTKNTAFDSVTAPLYSVWLHPLGTIFLPSLIFIPLSQVGWGPFLS